MPWKRLLQGKIILEDSDVDRSKKYMKPFWKKKLVYLLCYLQIFKPHFNLLLNKSYHPIKYITLFLKLLWLVKLHLEDTLIIPLCSLIHIVLVRLQVVFLWILEL